MDADENPANPAAGDLSGLVSGHAGPAMVCISTAWCTPCRLLAPLLPRLADELGYRLFHIDGNAAPEMVRRHAVKGFPTLLLIRDGVEVGRVAGFGGYDDLCDALAGCAALKAGVYRDTVVAAYATFAGAVAATQAAVDVCVAAVAPELDALQADLNRQQADGLITPEEAGRTLRSRHAELFAPFRDKLDAADDAEERALARYARQVSDADAQPRAKPAEAGPAGSQPAFCRIGDPSCGGR